MGPELAFLVGSDIVQSGGKNWFFEGRGQKSSHSFSVRSPVYVRYRKIATGYCGVKVLWGGTRKKMS